MKQIAFTEEFYKKVIDEVTNHCIENYDNVNGVECQWVEVNISIDEYDLSMTACVESEYCDESFNTDFGTCEKKGYCFGRVDSVCDLHVYFEGDEIDGLSEERINEILNK